MEFDRLVEKRRSCRAYEVSEPMTMDQVQQLIQATVQAPTWKNSETGRYYVAVSQEMMQKVREALPAFNQNSTSNACAYVVTTFVSNVAGHTNGQPDNELGNCWGSYDLGLQNAYLLLKAKDMGFDSLVMGIRDAEKLRQAFEIPQDQMVVSVIALGKGAGEPVLRTRKCVEEVCSVL
ncbi:MAG: nitroreductase family protein [Sphaerochaetaceae bacterium]|nr:nitroreductase family protein [Sphaerochaetaceae bacterium]